MGNNGRVRLPRRANETSFKPGHKKRRGRKAGVPNRITTSLREAILEAAALLGEDGKGKDGVVGYLVKVGREDMGLMVRLLEKVLPMQVTGANGGPIKMMALPPELLQGCSDAELETLQKVYERIGIGGVVGQAVLEATAQDGDPNSYAVLLENEPTTGLGH